MGSHSQLLQLHIGRWPHLPVPRFSHPYGGVKNIATLHTCKPLRTVPGTQYVPGECHDCIIIITVVIINRHVHLTGNSFFK